MPANLNRPAIAVRGLRKSYGEKVVLDGIDLTVAEGTIFSLLGPNGAGKTTMVQILSTLVRADSGEIRVAGHDPVGEPDGVRAAIGVTGQFSAIDKLLTGEENLLLMADLHHLGRREGRGRAAELLRQFDLVEAGGKVAATYSGGMQRRLDLAMTLVGAPRVIFLDEPTAGLDPRSRRGLWQIIRDLVASGVTIFLTTQYLEEADQLADRIALLDQGRLVAEGTPDELKRRIPGGHISLRFADPTELKHMRRYPSLTTVGHAVQQDEVDTHHTRLGSRPTVPRAGGCAPRGRLPGPARCGRSRHYRRGMATQWTLGCDAADPRRIAAFWAYALGYVAEPGYDDPDGASIIDPDGAGPAIGFLRVPEPKTAKNRMHIDIRVAGEPPWDRVERERLIRAKVEDLVGAGAVRVREEYYGERLGHVVMLDPEGNELCVA